MKNDEYFMGHAIDLAKKSAELLEVPVGALIVKNGQVISTGMNMRETTKNAVHHAEIEAINGACQKLDSWRLCGCELFVTLEPCPMCAGAIINSRIDRIVFGAFDTKAGACGSVVDLFSLRFNHMPEVKGGVMSEECAQLLSDFFRGLRYAQKHEKTATNT